MKKREKIKRITKVDGTELTLLYSNGEIHVLDLKPFLKEWEDKYPKFDWGKDFIDKIRVCCGTLEFPEYLLEVEVDEDLGELKTYPDIDEEIIYDNSISYGV